ncbi:hypothetical protein RM545_06845 [Zunongwangia sp. F260]|uniref:peptidylprolyl isomerase n=1 Tax=Autumnicola lenta TaxID=3075593 RepID=A0ABU3CJ65_9FLAO|nr:hypothetical protein [Zunongwangia sp. F260]MDT0646400.1 hypothetical protein [Zunongwangia sp. F260]
MRLKKLFLICATMSIGFISCNKDDDDETPTFEERDRGEQAIEDDERLVEFLSTHFYNYEEFQNPSEGFDYSIEFDTISGENSEKTSLLESEDLMVKSVTRDDVEYDLYILKVREGEGDRPTMADSTLVAYTGQLMNQTVFNENMVSPVWFDLPGYIILDANGRPGRAGGVLPGFSESLVEFKSSTGYDVNPDNTISWKNDYGIGAVFVPSGLAYFSSPPSGSGIPGYAPLIFKINLYRTVEADHDKDGIPSWMEDLDNDGNVFNDNTDGDNFPDHSDADDDGDGTPTRDEIVIREDGTLELTDTNNDGTPDYLDPDFFK